MCLMSILLLQAITGRNAFAEHVDIIKDGKIITGVIADFRKEYSLDTIQRLFRLTVILNQALIFISGDKLTEERFEKLVDRIKLKLDPQTGSGKYKIQALKTEKGHEILITSDRIETAEKAAEMFMNKYLKISDKRIPEIAGFIDTVSRLQDNEEEVKKIKAPEFQKVRELAADIQGEENNHADLPK